MNKDNGEVYKIVTTGPMAALCYVAFAFLRIPIPTFGGDMTVLRIGNAFCVLVALLLGSWYGGVVGAPGMTIVDILDPAYITNAPKTSMLKLCIGLIAGFIAHRIAKITEDHDNRYIFKRSLATSTVSLGSSAIMDPTVGYSYRDYVLGVKSSTAKIMSTWAAGVTLINAAAGTIVVVVVCMAVRPVLKKADLFFRT